jgi:peptidoglycan/xylan/chitin deacetylase (PgdA/CDA1 family)
MKQARVLSGWTRLPQLVVALLGLGLGILALLDSGPAQSTLGPVHAAEYGVLTEATTRVNCARVACLALTFDDGPKADTTPRVLDILARHRVRATFFVLGSHIPGNEALLGRIHQEGHEVGNHSWSHFDLTKMPPEQVRAEVMSTQSAVINAGVPAPQLFRAPYGALNEAAKAQIPLVIAGWNIDPEDWHPQKRAHMAEHLAGHAKPGGVVVMHDTLATTPDALDSLITGLGQQYTFVTVSELLNITPGQRGVFFGR